MFICLERGADLHMAQLMPLPLTVSCVIKIQIGFTFLVPAHQGNPGQRAIKRVYVCVFVCVIYYNFQLTSAPRTGNVLVRRAGGKMLWSTSLHSADTGRVRLQRATSARSTSCGRIHPAGHLPTMSSWLSC